MEIRFYRGGVSLPQGWSLSPSRVESLFYRGGVSLPLRVAIRSPSLYPGPSLPRYTKVELLSSTVSLCILGGVFIPQGWGLSSSWVESLSLMSGATDFLFLKSRAVVFLAVCWVTSLFLMGGATDFLSLQG